MSLSKATSLAARGNHSMAAVEVTPERIFQAIYNHRSRHRLNRLVSDGQYQLWHLETVDDKHWLLPRAKDALRITHIGKHPHVRVLRKYFDPIPLSVQDVDVVIDVGAFIGEFSRRLEKHNVDVLAVDADPKNVVCLQGNLPASMEKLHAVAWHSDEPVEVTAGVDSSETTALNVDDGTGIRERAEVSGRRITTMCNERGVEPDLIKIEAEGAEPEVLSGAIGVGAPVVIDVSDERDGESTHTMCDGILQSHNYESQYDAEAQILYGEPPGHGENNE